MSFYLLLFGLALRDYTCNITYVCTGMLYFSQKATNQRPHRREPISVLIEGNQSESKHYCFLLEFFNALRKDICDAGVNCDSFTLDSLCVDMRVLIGKFGKICFKYEVNVWTI